MRFNLFLCVCVLFLNCEDKQSKKKSNVITVETKDTIVKKSIEKPETDFPVLNDKNVIPFFAEYDKKHKENKVRITTDFGDIDILLYSNT